MRFFFDANGYFNYVIYNLIWSKYIKMTKLKILTTTLNCCTMNIIKEVIQND